MPEPIQIAIAGAAGQIGYALIFRLAAGGLFGPAQPIALSLLDVPEAYHLLQTDQLELRDCAFPLLADVSIHTDPIDAFKGADWIILLGSRPLRDDASHSRADLLLKNGPIYVAHGQAINAAAPTARVLVVAHPCNTNCLIAMSHARDVPAEHWFAMNQLDRMRATTLIAEKARVPIDEVTRVTVWGNHSESCYVDISNAFIGGLPALEVINDPDWVRDVMRPTVAQRTDQIIRLRGATPAGSAVQAILGTVQAIIQPTPPGRRFGAGVVSDGSYGVPRGLVFGFPLRSDDGVTWSIVQGLYLDTPAQKQLAANVAELEHEAVIVGRLLAGKG
jgi:malate dehydrogenase